MRERWALCWSATDLLDKLGMLVNVMQKYAHLLNGFATTVSFCAARNSSLFALTLIIGKQPGMHPPPLGVADPSRQSGRI